jgi:hypothetical protein
MMCAVDNPASCEIHAVIRFVHAENMSVAEIHRELCSVCGQNVMSEEIIRQWRRNFKDGRTKSEVIGLPSVVSDDLVQRVE